MDNLDCRSRKVIFGMAIAAMAFVAPVSAQEGPRAGQVFVRQMFVCGQAASAVTSLDDEGFTGASLGVDFDGDGWSYFAHDDGRWALVILSGDFACVRIMAKADDAT